MEIFHTTFTVNGCASITATICNKTAAAASINMCNSQTLQNRSRSGTEFSELVPSPGVFGRGGCLVMKLDFNSVDA